MLRCNLIHTTLHCSHERKNQKFSFIIFHSFSCKVFPYDFNGILQNALHNSLPKLYNKPPRNIMFFRVFSNFLKNSFFSCNNFFQFFHPTFSFFRGMPVLCNHNFSKNSCDTFNLRKKYIYSLNFTIHISAKQCYRKITVIPMKEEGEKGDEGEIYLNRNVDEDLIQTKILNSENEFQGIYNGFRLPLIYEIKNLNREEVVQVFKNVRHFSNVSDDFWEELFLKANEVCRCFLPSDIAIIYWAMWRCKKRNTDFVRKANQHLRRIYLSLSLDDIGKIAHVYQEMGWRSKDTLRKISTQFVAQIEKANAFHMREMVSVYPRLNIPIEEEIEKKVYKQVSNRLSYIIRTLTAKDFKIILNSYVKSKMFDEKIFNLCAKHIPAKLHTFTSTDMSVILNAYSRIDIRNITLLRGICNESLVKMQYFNAQDFSNILNAFVNLNFIDINYFEQAIPHLIQGMNSFTSQGLANIANAYARASIKNDVLFDQIAECAINIIDSFKAQELGNIANAFSKLEIQNKKLFSSIADEVIYRGTIGYRLKIFKFDIRSVEQLANAFAKLGLRDQRVFFVLTFLMKKALMSKKKSADVMDGQTIATIINAFGKAAVRMRVFTTFITYQIMNSKNKFSTSSLTNIVNACNKLSIKHNSIFMSILKQAKDRLNEFRPSNLVTLISAFSKIQIYKRNFYRQALKQCSIYLAQLDAIDLCTLSYALSENRYRDVIFMRKIGSAMKRRVNDLNTQGIANTICAFAKLSIYHEVEDIYDLLLKVAFEKQHDFNQQELLNMCFAFILNFNNFKVIDEKLFLALLHSVLKFSKSLHMQSIYQIQLVDLYLRLLHKELFDKLPLDIKEFLRKCRKVNVVVDPYMAKSSSMHRHISKYFSIVGLHNRNEVHMGPFIVDIVVGKKTAIEVDGPTHFYRECLHRTASSILKHRMLEAMGWRVLHIPYQEWEQCTTHRRRIVYCASFWKKLIEEDKTKTYQIGDVVDFFQQQQEHSDLYTPLLTSVTNKTSSSNFYEIENESDFQKKFKDRHEKEIRKTENDKNKKANNRLKEYNIDFIPKNFDLIKTTKTLQNELNEEKVKDVNVLLKEAEEANMKALLNSKKTPTSPFPSSSCLSKPFGGLHEEKPVTEKQGHNRKKLKHNKYGYSNSFEDIIHINVPEKNEDGFYILQKPHLDEQKKETKTFLNNALMNFEKNTENHIDTLVTGDDRTTFDHVTLSTNKTFGNKCSEKNLNSTEEKMFNSQKRVDYSNEENLLSDIVRENIKKKYSKLQWLTGEELTDSETDEDERKEMMKCFDTQNKNVTNEEEKFIHIRGRVKRKVEKLKKQFSLDEENDFSIIRNAPPKMKMTLSKDTSTNYHQASEHSSKSLVSSLMENTSSQSSSSLTSSSSNTSCDSSTFSCLSSSSSNNSTFLNSNDLTCLTNCKTDSILSCNDSFLQENKTEFNFTVKNAIIDLDNMKEQEMNSSILGIRQEGKRAIVPREDQISAKTENEGKSEFKEAQKSYYSRKKAIQRKKENLKKKILTSEKLIKNLSKNDWDIAFEPFLTAKGELIEDLDKTDSN